MGGLRKTMPVTFWTFVIGGLSLAGFPLLTAGFWSKDEILAECYAGMAEGFGAARFRLLDAGGCGLPDGLLHHAPAWPDLLGRITY